MTLPLDADPPLFREAALRAKYAAPAAAPLPELSAPRWGLLGVLVSAWLVLVAAACLGRVELTSIAHGALVVSQGPRAVIAGVPGRLVSLDVAAGSRVEAGQELGRIEVVELSARSRSAERKLDLARAAAERARAGSLELRRDMLDGLRKKREVIVQRLELERSVLALRGAREKRVAALARDRLASALDLESVAIETQNARGGVLFSKQQIADIDIEIAQHRLALEAEERALEREELDAELELGETRALAALASVRAPESGWVESLLVSPGQVVPSGSTLARVVPDGALTSAVVFVTADDAAFLRPGLEARMEFSSLPPSEFGRVRATVSRVSNDIALGPEVAEVLGEQAPREALVRVELSLLRDTDLSRMALHLRSGARVTARLTTRTVPAIVLLFEFARRWYEA